MSLINEKVSSFFSGLSDYPRNSESVIDAHTLALASDDAEIISGESYGSPRLFFRSPSNQTDNLKFPIIEISGINFLLLFIAFKRLHCTHFIKIWSISKSMQVYKISKNI